MSWHYSRAGHPIGRPSSEHGLYVEGPLTADDWKVILGGIVEEMIEQAKREAENEAGGKP